MEQLEVKYAPGMRIIVRGEEWMVKKVETNSLGNNQAYHYGMSCFEIYENTRCCWRVNKEQADKVKYAFSVYEGMVLEVFKIVQWLPAHSTIKMQTTLDARPDKDVGRLEFVGDVAEPEIRDKYIGKMVTELFPKGNQNPVKYIWGAKE